VAIVARTAPRPYHPSTAALVIEVAVASHARDLQDKAGLYSVAAVPTYWAIDLDHGTAIVHRDPTADGYRRVEQVGPAGVLSVELPGMPAVALGDLLAAANR
jgi:hypothetical protein